MKIRIFMNMDNSVFRVAVCTEDWSQDDLELMAQYGEPEVNVGGTVGYSFYGDEKSKEFGDVYARLIEGFPYSRGFDSRDYGSVDEAVAVGKSWKDIVVERISDAVTELRTNVSPLPNEEISEI